MLKHLGLAPHKTIGLNTHHIQHRISIITYDHLPTTPLNSLNQKALPPHAHHYSAPYLFKSLLFSLLPKLGLLFLSMLYTLVNLTDTQE